MASNDTNDFQVIDSTVSEELKDSNKNPRSHDKKGKTIKDSPKNDAAAEVSDDSKVRHDHPEECKNCQKNSEANTAAPEKGNEKPRSEKKSVKGNDVEKPKQPDYLIINEEEEDLDTSIDVNKNDEEGLCESSDNSEQSLPIKKQKDTEKLHKSSEKPLKKNVAPHKHVWVSNVNRGVKASDLKKLFSAHAKVTTAKIMTNGKRFFGYICFETSEMAERCVNELNNKKVSGKRITVSLQRPDLKTTVPSREDLKRKDVVEKKNTEVLPEVIVIDTPTENITEKTEPIATRPKRFSKEKDDIVQEKLQLQRRLRAAQADLMTYKKRISDYQNELQVKTDRCRSLRKDLDKITDQLHHERRRMTQERDQFKEKQKMEQIRFDTDRTMLNKEIDECKKLREYLESKINELADSRKRKAKSRSPIFRRSPPSVRRDVRHNPVRPRHDVPEKRGRFDSSKERNRTPPPPPKLTAEKSLSRGHDNYSTIKGKNSQPRHASPPPPRGHFIESTRGRNENPRSIVPPSPPAAHSRNPPWQTSYPGQVWRPTGYGDGFQGPPGAANRDNMFYPNFGKSHPGLDSANRRY